MSADNIQFLAIVLANLNNGSANWQEIATQRAIAREDNALTIFKKMIQKIGNEHDGKKLIFIDGFDSVSLGSTKGRKSATPRKRKGNAEGAGQTNGTKSPIKKRRIAKYMEESDDSDDGDQKDIKAEPTETSQAITRLKKRKLELNLVSDLPLQPVANT